MAVEIVAVGLDAFIDGLAAVGIDPASFKAELRRRLAEKSIKLSERNR